jgi:hypothetical protein
LRNRNKWSFGNPLTSSNLSSVQLVSYHSTSSTSYLRYSYYIPPPVEIPYIRQRTQV